MTRTGGRAQASAVAASSRNVNDDRECDRDRTRGRNLVRWECRCQDPPVLLGTYDAGGRINIKMRDRYWHIDGVVQTACPRCGSEHTLDLSRQVDEAASRQEES